MRENRILSAPLILFRYIGKLYLSDRKGFARMGDVESNAETGKHNWEKNREKQKKEEKHMFTLGAVAIGGTLVSGGLGILIFWLTSCRTVTGGQPAFPR